MIENGHTELSLAGVIESTPENPDFRRTLFHAEGLVVGVLFHSGDAVMMVPSRRGTLVVGSRTIRYPPGFNRVRRF